MEGARGEPEEHKAERSARCVAVVQRGDDDVGGISERIDELANVRCCIVVLRQPAKAG